MSKPEAAKAVDIKVKITAETYRTFVLFDLLRHQKRWRRPAVFAAMMLVFAGICLSQIGKKDGAGLLTAVLALVGLGLPAVYFGLFLNMLSKQCKALKKAGPTLAYRLRMTNTGLEVWQPGEMERAEAPQSYEWQQLHMVYRTADAVYLYVQPSKAFLLPADQTADNCAAAWALAQSCPNRREVK